MKPFISAESARKAAVLWGLFLLGLTSWPSPPEVPVVSWIPNFDKLVHGLLYGVEGFLLYRAVAWPAESRSRWLRALAIAGAIAVWGTIDEIHQAWIPRRVMQASDVLADTLGGFLGAVAAARIWRPISPRPSDTHRQASLPIPESSPPASRS